MEKFQFPPIKCFYSFLRKGLLIDRVLKLNISPFVTLYLCKMFCFWGEGWGYTSFCWVGKSDGRSLYMLYNTITLRMNARHYYYMQGPSQTWPFQVQCCYYYIKKLVGFIWTVWHCKNSSALLIINSQFSCFLQ